MAEGLLRHKLVQQGLADEFEAASAGVWTHDGCPATEYAVAAMAERGIDISAHRSRNLTEQIVADAALILTMTRGHAEAIRAEFPACASKVYLLSEMSGSRSEVDDPVGRSFQVYQATVRELERLIDAGWNRLIELARKV